MSKERKPRYGDVVKAVIEEEYSDLAAEVLSGETDALYWPAFKLGRLTITHGAIASVPAEEALRALGRHGRCDWGDLREDEREANKAALRKRGRVRSRYRTSEGAEFCLVTESGGSRTTISLPGEI